MKPFLYASFFAATVFFTVLYFFPAHAQHHDVPTLWRLDTAKNADTAKTPEVAASSEFKDTIEVDVYNLAQYYGDQSVVELEPKNFKSDYILPVVIGSCEMNGLYSQIHNVASPRPMTYDLMTTILKSTGVKIKTMIINKLEDNTYYATLILDSNGNKVEVDARPSDAINLALRAGVRMYVERAVFDEAKEKKTGSK